MVPTPHGRYYNSCFTNEEKKSEELRNLPVCPSRKWQNSFNPHAVPDLITSGSLVHWSLSFQCSPSLCPPFSLHSTYIPESAARIILLQTLSFLVPHSFHHSQTAKLNLLIPAPPTSFPYQSHWWWAGENTQPRSLVLSQIRDHKPLPCLATLPHLFSQSSLSLFKTTMVKSSHCSNILPGPLLLTFWWRLCFSFNWKNMVTIWREMHLFSWPNLPTYYHRELQTQPSYLYIYS